MLTSNIIGKHGRIFEQKENWGKAHICEFHRRIYDEVIIFGNEELTAKLVPLIEKAYILGVKMQNKLVEYKLQQIPPFEESVEDTGMALKRRDERKRLQELLTWGQNEISTDLG